MSNNTLRLESAIAAELERWFDSASAIARNWIDFRNEARTILHILRARDAEQLRAQSLNISPERVQKVERIERVVPLQDVVERVARAIYDAEPEPEKPYSQWWDWKRHAKAAIAAMPLCSVGLSDAKGQEEAERPAKEFGVEIHGSAPSSTSASNDKSDREAFEKWFINEYSSLCAGTQGAWREFSETKIAFKSWQAARDHYAPENTKRNAVNVICHRLSCWPDDVVDALNKAGIKFKD